MIQAEIGCTLASNTTTDCFEKGSLYSSSEKSILSQSSLAIETYNSNNKEIFVGGGGCVLYIYFDKLK
jgi:hypothetical protein